MDEEENIELNGEIWNYLKTSEKIIPDLIESSDQSTNNLLLDTVKKWSSIDTTKYTNLFYTLNNFFEYNILKKSYKELRKEKKKIDSKRKKRNNFFLIVTIAGGVLLFLPSLLKDVSSGKGINFESVVKAPIESIKFYYEKFRSLIEDSTLSKSIDIKKNILGLFEIISLFFSTTPKENDYGVLNLWKSFEEGFEYYKNDYTPLLIKEKTIDLGFIGGSLPIEKIISFEINDDTLPLDFSYLNDVIDEKRSEKVSEVSNFISDTISYNQLKLIKDDEYVSSMIERYAPPSMEEVINGKTPISPILDIYYGVADKRGIREIKQEKRNEIVTSLIGPYVRPWDKDSSYLNFKTEDDVIEQAYNFSLYNKMYYYKSSFDSGEAYFDYLDYYNTHIVSTMKYVFNNISPVFEEYVNAHFFNENIYNENEETKTGEPTINTEKVGKITKNDIIATMSDNYYFLEKLQGVYESIESWDELTIELIETENSLLEEIRKNVEKLKYKIEKENWKIDINDENLLLIISDFDTRKKQLNSKNLSDRKRNESICELCLSDEVSINLERFKITL